MAGLLSPSHRYTPYYCEENVWHLCREPCLSAFEKEAVFISNPQRACLLWEQKASGNRLLPVCWDYHVILMVRQASWMAWDLDSRLGYPVEAQRYFDQTFTVRPPHPFRGAPPLFRVWRGAEFLAEFDSDRSHMRVSDGGWQAPPPPWPAIRSPNGCSLQSLIDMERAKPGEVLTLDELQQRYGESRAKPPRAQS